MELDDSEAKSLRDLVHDINGQIFLIRGHVEIAKRSDLPEQQEKCLRQIQASSDELERLMKEMRVELGIPGAIQKAWAILRIAFG